MVVDKIENFGRYKSLLKNSEELIEFFKNNPTLSEQEEITLGDYVFTPFRFESGDSAEKRWEIHRYNIDIHIAIENREAIEWIPVTELKQSEEVWEDPDCEFFADKVKGTELILEPGYFAILLPQDAHKPSIKTDKTNGGLKTVIKADATYVDANN